MFKMYQNFEGNRPADSTQEMSFTSDVFVVLLEVLRKIRTLHVAKGPPGMQNEQLFRLFRLSNHFRLWFL